MVLNLSGSAAVGLFAFAVFVYTYSSRIVKPRDPPNTPITVPYLIPWIGSFFTFNKDPLECLKQYHLSYGKYYKIYAAGRAVVVITDPDGVASISRDTTKHLDHKLVFSHILHGIAGFGSSIDFIQDLLDSKIFPIVKTSLSPALMSEVTGTVDSLIPLELERFYTSNSKATSLNLLEVIGRPIYNAGSLALFGPTFPLDSFHDFLELDSFLPQLLTRLPFIAQRGRFARLRMVSHLEKCIEEWWATDGTQDIPHASTTVMLSLTELKAAQVSRRDAAGTLLLFLWGFHSNMWFMIFWLLTHLVVDRTSMTRMISEIESFRAKHSLDQLDDPHCTPPLLESAIQETLRWATTSTTARYATEDTAVVVDGTPVPIMKGEYVLGDIRAVHYDPEVYEHPYEFKIDRYVTKNDDRLAAPKPSPWGRGKHMCVGRHVAVHVMRRFAVELLSTYDIVPTKPSSDGPKIPSINTRHFLGSLKSTEDFQILLSRRA
ncbi:cytochrome P450 [Agrocybe pediades]|nr:cytochrome P450 [Agrocybe pediades]